MDENPKEVLKAARKKIEDIDIIINLYTMRIMWTSNRFAKNLGYSQKEMENLHVKKLVHYNEKTLMRDLGKILINTITNDAREILKKNGKRIMTSGEIHTLIFKGVPHIVITNITFGKK